ncbi:MAG: hemerythrin domain-containing protein [Desulfomonile tiedjei]|nr:hemerythrin domain-containing protein [Desulfomonile tiedjei]
MKATEQLRAEHHGIQVMLQVLKAICLKLQAGEKVNPDHVEKIIEFFRLFADRCHHGKEEDLLFPAMEAAGVPKHGGPLGVMLAEHDVGRGYLRAMAEALEKYRSEDVESAADLAAHARKYIAFLNLHIEKENTVLFPMADSRLPAEKQDQLYEEFEKFEEEKIGSGVHEQFHKLLDDLAHTYLGRAAA